MARESKSPSFRRWAIVALVGGGLLLIASAVPLYFQFQEAVLGWVAYKQYRVTRVDELHATIDGTKVYLTDQLFGVEPQQEAQFQWVPLRIRVDDDDWSISTPVRVNTAEDGAGRYLHWAALGEIHERRQGTRHLVAVQRIPDTRHPRRDDSADPEHWSYRLVRMGSDGLVEEEEFSVEERSRSVYRTLLARLASPTPIGFRSSALALYPTLLYPIVYPWFSFLAGLALMGFGGFIQRRQGRLK